MDGRFSPSFQPSTQIRVSSSAASSALPASSAASSSSKRACSAADGSFSKPPIPPATQTYAANHAGAASTASIAKMAPIELPTTAARSTPK